MSCYKEPQVTFEKKNYKNEEYLYIYQNDPNYPDKDDRISWTYIELKGFWMKKHNRDLCLGNYLGEVYALTGYSDDMVNKWVNEIKKTIGYP